LARKGAVEVGVFLYLEPIVTTLAAAPILGEKITVAVIISAILIISGVSLAGRRIKEN
jgi:drug/metabolite transporter (DMT)-like permease